MNVLSESPNAAEAATYINKQPMNTPTAFPIKVGFSKELVILSSKTSNRTVELTGSGDYIQASIRSIKLRNVLPALRSNDLLGRAGRIQKTATLRHNELTRLPEARSSCL